MFSHPAREASLIFYRAVSIWSGGTPYPLEDFIGTPSLRFRWVLACNLFAALGAFAGIDHPLPRTQPVRRPVTAFPLIYPWAFYLTLALPRYRLPIDPIVLLLLAISIQHLARKRARSTAPVTNAQLPSPPRHKRKKTRSPASR